MYSEISRSHFCDLPQVTVMSIILPFHIIDHLSILTGHDSIFQSNTSVNISIRNNTNLSLSWRLMHPEAADRPNT